MGRTFGTGNPRLGGVGILTGDRRRGTGRGTGIGDRCGRPRRGSAPGRRGAGRVLAIPRKARNRPRIASEAIPAAMFPIPDSRSLSRSRADSRLEGRRADTTTS
jgi:hypothetical protein